MGQSLAQTYIHLTFGTKGRQPFIQPQYQSQLHAYIADTLQSFESPAILVNSVEDHIHILFRQSKNFALADIVEDVKKRSSRWYKTLHGSEGEFRWQIGYGAFSVSSSKLETVRHYIATQKEHHAIKCYRSEMEQFFAQYGGEYDERYYWD